ncbi:polysaccharide biosynthesis/export family protein [Mesorhizobium sp. M0833]|uniref:polysaccharide biosynthesis/export family protein n=1 Tax=unclassified Mesorhizobium TaxID=325217 RepID=UPI0020C9E5DC|nr:polysaccharide biosynthesis/export family protein [Mesorhizobium sp. LMG 17147]MCP9229067.1 polysaccharide biosynthesis/export family protein [Mesorhizobium sp. LMG 17147]
MRRVRLLTTCLTVATGLTLSLALPQFAFADDYRLGAQDKLTIRVAEWQTVEGTFRDWSAINGEYTVGPAGTLSVPFVGEMPASGKTTSEIAASLGEALQRKLALADRPEASVEMAQYRPFYISGEVQAPGQYPCVPGLTVLKAMSIAGGARRTPESGQRYDRDLINAKGNFDVLQDQLVRLTVKRARIEAELADKPTFAVPKEVADDPKLPSIVADETAILAADQKKLKLRLQALDDLKALLQSEIDSLQKKIVNQQKQVDLAKEQLNGIGSLAQKGLVVNTRVLNSQQTIADLEGQILDYETAILTAKQSISKATQDAIDLENTQNSSLATDRQQTEADLNEVTLKLNMEKALMSEALSGSPMPQFYGNNEPAALSFSLVRVVDGKTSEITADEDTPVLPGDVIKVKPAPLAIQ